jgi:hypothetical protein
MILTPMRFSIEVKDSVLGELLKLTGLHKRSPAVVLAVEDYVRRQKMRDLGQAIRRGALAGAFEPDYDPDSPTCFRVPDPHFRYSDVRPEFEPCVLSEAPPPPYGEAPKPAPATPDPKAPPQNGDDPR